MTREQREEVLRKLKGCRIRKPHVDVKFRTVSSLKRGFETEINNRKCEFFSCRNKKRYRTHGDAMKVVNYFRTKNDGDWTRVYQCSICGGYHITSKPLKPSKTTRINLNRKRKRRK